MKTSIYTIIIEDLERSVIYNTINGIAINISRSSIKDDSLILSSLTNDQVKYLEDNNFIFKDNNAERQFVEDKYQDMIQHEFDKTLYITIELTTLCNFKCGFCYQNEWEQRAGISNKVIEKLIKVISNSDLSEYKEINLNFIGGEPLLYTQQLMDIYHYFSDLCHNKSMLLSIKLNTNGVNLNNDLLSVLKNTTIVLPFMPLIDYSSGVVKFKGYNSCHSLYKLILDKIGEIKGAINNEESNKLILRFNANHNNILHFEDHLNLISSLEIANVSVDVVNTSNSPEAAFINRLSEQQFDTWYKNIAIKLLLNHGFKPHYRPRNALTRCKGRRLGSFKLFADGRIGLCNGIKYDNGLQTIFEVQSISEINNIYKGIKSHHYIYSQQCISCRYIFICGGESPCSDKPCSKSFKNIESYVLKMMQYKK